MNYFFDLLVQEEDHLMLYQLYLNLFFCWIEGRFQSSQPGLNTKFRPPVVGRVKYSETLAENL